jgi:D-glycero-alpha-D-manno-heptose-7-phosphate kinase
MRSRERRLIISRTPFRVSFFGGGTDYPAWYTEHGGMVVATTIKQYGYIAIQIPPPLFPYKYQLRYIQDERVNNVEDIDHPSIRECIKYLGITSRLDLVYTSDLPSMSGMGTSSAFTVGCLHALHALEGRMVSKDDLAAEALEVEQVRIKEAVGSQDQILAAHGGPRIIEFGPNREDYSTRPLYISPEVKDILEDWLLLAFTKFQRKASDVASVQIAATPHRVAELTALYDLTKEASNLMCNGNFEIGQFGKLLGEGWRIKKSLTHKITNKDINDIHDTVMSQGAIGCKLSGAGSGGFMLICAPPDRHQAIRDAVEPLSVIPFEIESRGSEIILYQPTRGL